jgi:hypothetical protein
MPWGDVVEAPAAASSDRKRTMRSVKRAVRLGRATDELASQTADVARPEQVVRRRPEPEAAPRCNQCLALEVMIEMRCGFLVSDHRKASLEVGSENGSRRPATSRTGSLTLLA